MTNQPPQRDFVDYYAILGVEPTASEDEIKKAFRRFSKENHPDVLASQKLLKEDLEARLSKAKEVGQAYDALKDTGRRQKYDEIRRQAIGLEQEVAAGAEVNPEQAAHVKQEFGSWIDETAKLYMGIGEYRGFTGVDAAALYLQDDILGNLPKRPEGPLYPPEPQQARRETQSAGLLTPPQRRRETDEERGARLDRERLEREKAYEARRALEGVQARQRAEERAAEERERRAKIEADQAKADKQLAEARAEREKDDAARLARIQEERKAAEQRLKRLREEREAEDRKILAEIQARQKAEEDAARTRREGLTLPDKSETGKSRAGEDEQSTAQNEPPSRL